MKTICIDFDGVIHDNMNYKGTDIINGSLVDGVADALDRLSKEYKILIHSARCESDKAMNNIRQWLKDNNINYELVKMKPNAHIFIDDRAIGFNGNWNETIKDVGKFKQWQEDDKKKSRRYRALNKRNIPIISQ